MQNYIFTSYFMQWVFLKSHIVFKLNLCLK